MIKKVIQIFFVENNLSHVQLIEDELKKAGVLVELVPLSTRHAFMREMQGKRPDVVLVCYEDGGFSSLDCLRLHKQLAPQIPLLVVANHPGEERVVEIMREGACDVIFEHNLGRLAEALMQAVGEALEKQPQNQHEESLQLNQQHLRNLFKMTPVGVFRCDPEKNCFFVNDRFCEITGLSSAEALGTGWIEALHPQDKDFILADWYSRKGVVEEIKAIYRYLNTKTGETAWVIGQSISETDSTGRVVGYLGSITDITRLKSTEEALKEKNEYLVKVNQELDSFVYSASHNLRGPLASLMGLINLIRLESEHPQSLGRICNMMDQSLKKLDGFIRDILDHSRNARLNVHHQIVDVRSLLQEVLEEFTLQEEYSAIEMQVLVQQELPLYSDTARLRIILRNLLSNSIRYYSRHLSPKITITVRVNEEEVILQVSDNGIGIRKEHQPRVFDMFYRADDQRSGSGLGLYITREVVGKMGGTIELSSEFAKGTLVRVVLPNQKAGSALDASGSEIEPGWFIN